MTKRSKHQLETTIGIDDLASIIEFISDQQTFFYILQLSKLIVGFVRKRWIECNVTFNLKTFPTEPLHYVNILNINFRCIVYFWHVKAENGCLVEKFPNLRHLIVDGSQNEFSLFIVSTKMFFDTIFPTSNKVVHLEFKNIMLDRSLSSFIKNRNQKSLKLKNVKPHKLNDVDLRFIDSFEIDRLKINKTRFKIDKFPQTLSKLSIDLRPMDDYFDPFEQVRHLSRLKSIRLHLSLEQCNVEGILTINNKTLENVKIFCDSHNGETFQNRFDFCNIFGDLPSIKVLRLCFSLFKSRNCACISETYLISDRVVHDDYISKCEIDNVERNGVIPQNMEFVRSLKAKFGLNHVMFVVNNIYNGSYLYRN